MLCKDSPLRFCCDDISVCALTYSGNMKHIPRFAIVVLMSTLAVSQTLTPPQAITDPRQITAKPDANVEQGEEGLSLERLYMTRQIGGTAWSPDGKSVVFV